MQGSCSAGKAGAHKALVLAATTQSPSQAVDQIAMEDTHSTFAVHPPSQVQIDLSAFGVLCSGQGTSSQTGSCANSKPGRQRGRPTDPPPVAWYPKAQVNSQAVPVEPRHGFEPSRSLFSTARGAHPSPSQVPTHSAAAACQRTAPGGTGRSSQHRVATRWRMCELTYVPLVADAVVPFVLSVYAHNQLRGAVAGAVYLHAVAGRWSCDPGRAHLQIARTVYGCISKRYVDLNRRHPAGQLHRACVGRDEASVTLERTLHIDCGEAWVVPVVVAVWNGQLRARVHVGVDHTCSRK